MHYILIGLLVGIVTTAPVGPVNVIAIQRAFRFGFLQGLLTGLGAVLADTLFATVSVFGISAVSRFVEGHSSAIQGLGGVLLIVFGFWITRSHPHLEKQQQEGTQNVLRNFLAACAMTLTNPGAVLGFIAIFGSLGHLAPHHDDNLGASLLVLGVASGATLWWVLISWLISHVRSRITDHWLEWINRAAGGVLILFGGGILIRLAVILL